MRMNRSNFFRTLALYSPIIFSWVLMIPRLLSPQFGFFDDAATLANSEGILEGTWSPLEEAAYGRFRPLYWLYYAFIYFFTGQNPFWFFMGNLFIWTLLTFSLITLVRSLGGNRLQVWSASILFILAGTTIENAYTLSKPELQQFLWIMLSILVISFRLKTKSNLNWVVGMLLSSIAVLLSCLSKETSMLLLPISVGWFLFSWVLKFFSKSSNPALFQAKRNYLFATVLGVSAYVILRSKFLPYSFIEEGYPGQFNFALEHVKSNARIWVDLLSRDYLYLIPLSILPLMWAIQRRRIPNLEKIFDTSLWMFAWIVIYIPWIFTQEYYLLPFALGAAHLGSILLNWNVNILRDARFTWRIPLAIPLTVAIILLLITIPSQITKARAQLAIDASNDEMLTHVLENAPRNSVVLINIQDPNEYVGHFTTLVKVIGGRSDLVVDYFQYQDILAEGWEGKPITIVSPIVENQFYPSMRMGVFEMPSRTWHQSLLEYLGDRGELASQIRNSFQSALIDTPRAICFVFQSPKVCQKPHTPIDNRVFAYGWDIYHLSPSHDGE